MNSALQLAISSLPYLLKATEITVVLAVASICLGLIIGLLTAVVRIAKIPVLSAIATGYVSLFRGTPLLVQIYVVYYGFPSIGITLGPISSGILALSLNSGAYLAESFRGAVESVANGQYEAGFTIGMTYAQIMRRIIIPQSIRTALPTIGNTFVGLLKDTSLVSVITVTELLRSASLVIARTFEPLPLYIEAALIYWLLSNTFSLLQGRVERLSSRHV